MTYFARWRLRAFTVAGRSFKQSVADMTTTDIINRVRRLVQDTESGNYHWTDEQLKKDIQLAVRALHKERPETRYVDGSVVDYVVLPLANTDAIDIDSRYEDCLAYYAAYMAYSDDCNDPVSKTLADDFLTKFKTFAQM